METLTAFQQSMLMALQNEKHEVDWTMLFTMLHYRANGPKMVDFAKPMQVSASIIDRLMDPSRENGRIQRSTRTRLAKYFIKLDQKGKLDDVLLGFLGLKRPKQKAPRKTGHRKAHRKAVKKAARKSTPLLHQAANGLSKHVATRRRNMEIQEIEGHPFARKVQEIVKYSDIRTPELIELLQIPSGRFNSIRYGQTKNLTEKEQERINALHGQVDVPQQARAATNRRAVLKK